MSENGDKLNRDAEALDEVAGAADYLAGLAEGDEDKRASIHADAATLRRWAGLCRSVAASAE